MPLYLENDVIARRRAENFSDAEQRLVARARQHQRTIQRRSLPTIAHELSLVDPKIPAAWLDQVVAHYSPTGTRLSFERRLPVEIQVAIDEYRDARLRLTQLRRTQFQVTQLQVTQLRAETVAADAPPSISPRINFGAIVPADVAGSADVTDSADVAGSNAKDFARSGAWQARSN